MLSGVGFCDKFPSFSSSDYYRISPLPFSSDFQEYFLLRLLSSMHKLIPLVLGKLSQPDRGQYDITFSHLASCDRVWKPQQRKCETSVLRNLNVHGIHNVTEIKTTFFLRQTTCFTISKPAARSKNVQKVGNSQHAVQYIEWCKRKKERGIFHITVPPTSKRLSLVFRTACMHP